MSRDLASKSTHWNAKILPLVSFAFWNMACFVGGLLMSRNWCGVLMKLICWRVERVTKKKKRIVNDQGMIHKKVVLKRIKYDFYLTSPEIVRGQYKVWITRTKTKAVTSFVQLLRFIKILNCIKTACFLFRTKQ